MSNSIIKRSTAKSMVDKYQKAPVGSINPNTSQVPPLTKFVHFTLAQFFELMTLNGIVKDSDTIGAILESKSNFGIKIYLAQHVDASDCPDNDATQIGSNTVVIVNTVMKDFIWYDIPEPNSGITEVREFETPTSGQAVDKGNKCPPECGSFSNSL